METRSRGQQAWSQISARTRRNLSKLSILFLVMSSQMMGMGQNPGPEDRNPGRPQAAEIPFKLYNDNLIIVKGTVGTIKGVNLILDTGTTPTSISKSLASRLKLHGNTEPLKTLNGVIQTESFTLPHIEVAAFSANELRVVTQDFKFMEDSLGLTIGGILGLDVLRSHAFTIDYRKKKISFGTIREAKNLVHFETQSPLLTVKASVEGQELRLIVDSGTSGLVIFGNRFKENAGALRSAQGTFITTVAGTPQAKFFRTSVTLGQNTGERTITIAEANLGAGDGFDGLLGFTGMGFRTVYFDFENGTLGWE